MTSKPDDRPPVFMLQPTFTIGTLRAVLARLHRGYVLDVWQGQTGEFLVTRLHLLQTAASAVDGANRSIVLSVPASLIIGATHRGQLTCETIAPRHLRFSIPGRLPNSSSA